MLGGDTAIGVGSKEGHPIGQHHGAGRPRIWARFVPGRESSRDGQQIAPDRGTRVTGPQQVQQRGERRRLGPPTTARRPPPDTTSTVASASNPAIAAPTTGSDPPRRRRHHHPGRAQRRRGSRRRRCCWPQRRRRRRTRPTPYRPVGCRSACRRRPCRRTRTWRCHPRRDHPRRSETSSRWGGSRPAPGRVGAAGAPTAERRGGDELRRKLVGEHDVAGELRAVVDDDDGVARSGARRDALLVGRDGDADVVLRLDRARHLGRVELGSGSVAVLLTVASSVSTVPSGRAGSMSATTVIEPPDPGATGPTAHVTVVAAIVHPSIAHGDETGTERVGDDDAEGGRPAVAVLDHVRRRRHRRDRCRAGLA